MIYNYKSAKRKINGENGKYSAYGVELDGKILLNDITCDKTFADEIVEKLNKFQASPIHISEIVENMIIQKYS